MFASLDTLFIVCLRNHGSKWISMPNLIQQIYTQLFIRKIGLLSAANAGMISAAIAGFLSAANSGLLHPPTLDCFLASF